MVGTNNIEQLREQGKPELIWLNSLEFGQCQSNLIEFGHI